MEMPIISYKPQNASEDVILCQITSKDGRLRASRPKDGIAAYVWRHVAFTISPISQHHCMPVTSYFWLPSGHYDTKELDALVNKIVNEVPKGAWHGVAKWRGLI
jgi:phenylpropionate dioxygenase-like ring-hydroxylating dioxygenase large terminal subunit